MRGSTLVVGRHVARVFSASRDQDVVSMAPCLKAGRPWHPLGADGRAVCPVCFPSVYSRRHAKHRAAVAS